MYPYSDEQLEHMIDQQLYYNNYSAAEVDYLVDRAVRDASYVANEQTRYLETFCNFLDMIGLGSVAAAIRIARWGWERAMSLWNWITGKNKG